MALNIYEELDLTSSGDNVDEGFLKCKNNWEDWDTELNNARDGEASLIAKLDAVETAFIPSLVGYKSRSIFSYNDNNTIYVSGGSYEVNGTIATISGSITTTAHAISGTDWVYLYIDYSSIPSSGVLVQSDLIWSTTEPAWSHSNVGWYNGNDRCIFAVHLTSDDIDEFYHDGNFVQFDETINIDSGTPPATFTDIGTAFTLPVFCTRVLVSFHYDYSSASGGFYWRTNGSSSSLGHIVGFVDSDSQASRMQSMVTTDSNHLIEIKTTTAANTYIIYENGWFLPEGI